MKATQFKVAITFDKEVMFAPVQLQPQLLPALQDLQAHPEEAKDPADLVSWILANVYIKWEDIVDPGQAKLRTN
jgi:hypothetical protein